MLRSYRLVSLLVAVALVGALSACGGSALPAGSASCTNYALHGAGKYHNEVSVRVEVSNSTAHPARYAVDVALTAGRGAPADAASTHVTIHGSVAAHASAELGRKVLTADPDQRCRVIRITRLSRS